MTTRKLLTLATAIVVVDQATKLAIKGFDLFGIQWQGMMLYESRQLMGDVVRLTFVQNPGMAFGWNFDMPMVLSLFSVLASAFLVYLIRRTEGKAPNGLRLAFAVILGGAVGNLIDRVFYGLFYGYASLFHGQVVDFIDIDLPDISILGRHLDRFYVFNIADAAVSVGVVLLLIFYPSKKQAATVADPGPVAPLEHEAPHQQSLTGTEASVPPSTAVTGAAPGDAASDDATGNPAATIG